MRLEKSARKIIILEAACAIARSKGHHAITLENLAKKSKNSRALISHHFGTSENLHKEIIRYAIRNERYEVLAQFLLCSPQYASLIPDGLKINSIARLLLELKSC